MSNLFKASRQQPFHLSVGAVLTNSEGHICSHYFEPAINRFETENKNTLYLLMRETIEEDETIMSAINRGLLEEFGAKGSVKNFIGSIKSEFPFKNKTGIVEKTTLYFHVELIEQDYAWRDKNDYEGNSNLVWLESAMLIKRMETQKSENYTGLDESMIIKNYLKLKKNNNE